MPRLSCKHVSHFSHFSHLMFPSCARETTGIPRSALGPARPKQRLLVRLSAMASVPWLEPKARLAWCAHHPGPIWLTASQLVLTSPHDKHHPSKLQILVLLAFPRCPCTEMLCGRGQESKTCSVGLETGDFVKGQRGCLQGGFTPRGEGSWCIGLRRSGLNMRFGLNMRWIDSIA